MFERNYVDLVKDVLANGHHRQTRNSETLATFGKTIEIDCLNKGIFPLLLGRKLYYKGVLGELAAFLGGPKHVKDFEAFNCNYWADWADDDGQLQVDYGNAWLDYNGVNQLKQVTEQIKADPYSRRHLIDAWQPDKLDKLSLPCCHYSYQWFVNGSNELEMLWNQRSCDVMIGLPSDIILAAAMNLIMANETGYKPGRITMVLGDTHIYQDHVDTAIRYIKKAEAALAEVAELPKHLLRPETSWETFVPSDLLITGYPENLPKLKFKLHK